MSSIGSALLKAYDEHLHAPPQEWHAEWIVAGHLRPSLAIALAHSDGGSSASIREAVREFLLERLLHTSSSQLQLKHDSDHVVYADGDPNGMPLFTVSARELRAREHQMRSLLLLECLATLTDPVEVRRVLTMLSLSLSHVLLLAAIGSAIEAELEEATVAAAAATVPALCARQAGLRVILASVGLPALRVDAATHADAPVRQDRRAATSVSCGSQAALLRIAQPPASTQQ